MENQEEVTYKLSPQFVECVMLALQKTIKEQCNIVEIFKSWDCAVVDEQLVVTSFIGVHADPKERS